MESALGNHAGRAGADIAVVLDSKGQPLASMGIEQIAMAAILPPLVARAADQGQADQIISTGERALQMFVVPVRGAGLRAWLVAGFTLDDGFAQRLAELTDTDIIFRSRSGAPLASSRATETDSMPPANANGDMIETGGFFSRILELGSGQPSPVQAVLLIDREQAMANYYDRAADLGIILLLAVSLSGLVVLVMARALGRPVLELARFATAIGDGRSAKEPATPRTGELRTLQGALISMQQRVRERELFHAWGSA